VLESSLQLSADRGWLFFVGGAGQGTTVVVWHRGGLFADVIRVFLEEEGFRVMITTNLEEALDLARGAESCLLDLGMIGALDGLRQLRSLPEPLRVLALVEDGDPQQMRGALSSGANGCVTTADDLDRLVHLLSRDASDQESGRATHERIGLGGARTNGKMSLLTAREEEVLRGLVWGESTKSLAARMKVSPATTRTHVQNLLAKLGVHSRLQAVALAVEGPLVSLSALEEREDTVATVGSH
jgi:two-component system, NarL family, nitrate/nitrite response regulator NarL